MHVLHKATLHTQTNILITTNVTCK